MANSYTKKSRLLFYIFLSLFSFLVMESLYLCNTYSMSSASFEKKSAFVKVSGLPDLALSTEATYVRHRSLSDLFSIYKDDATLREYFPSTFVISHSHIINPHAKKISNEK